METLSHSLPLYGRVYLVLETGEEGRLGRGEEGVEGMIGARELLQCRLTQLMELLSHLRQI